MSATTTKSDYIQPSSLLPYDSSQSPLALLAQTCSSIGKDCCTLSGATPPAATPKSSSIVSHSSKKRSSTSPSSPTKKFAKELTPSPVPFDSGASLAELFLRSPLAYFSLAHSYSTPCTIPACLQCQTTRYILSSSMNTQSYACHWFTCNARFSTNSELLDHIRCHHPPLKTPQPVRFHPYLKSAKLSHANDPLPCFYPHLSFSADRESNRDPNNKN